MNISFSHLIKYNVNITQIQAAEINILKECGSCCLCTDFGCIYLSYLFPFISICCIHASGVMLTYLPQRYLAQLTDGREIRN